MNVILQGIGASGVIPSQRALSVVIKSINLNIPLDEMSTDRTVTVSGSITGAKSFHNDVTSSIKFGSNERVVITTQGFTADTSLVIDYIYTGDQSMYMEADPSRQRYYIPSRLRS